MAFTEFFVMKTAGGGPSDSNGGGPRKDTDNVLTGGADGPVFVTADATVAGGTPTVIKDNTVAEWANGSFTVEVGDFLLWDVGGNNELRRIDSIADIGSGNITVDQACTPVANADVIVGGAWLTLGYADSAVDVTTINVASDPPRCNIGPGAWAERLEPTGVGTMALPITFQGFTSTPGDGGLATLTDNTSDPLIKVAFGIDWIRVVDLDVTTTGTGADAVALEGDDGFALRVRGRATSATTRAVFYAAGAESRVVNCYAHDSSELGFQVGTRSIAIGCVAFNITSGYGFNVIGTSAACFLCVAANTSDDGFFVFARSTGLLNCIGYKSTAGSGVRLDLDVDTALPPIVNCIFYGNNRYAIECDEACSVHNDYNAVEGVIGVDTYLNVVIEGESNITLTNDPFVNAADGNFALNNAPGGGQACRKAGFPGIMVDGVNVGYADIGTIQHNFEVTRLRRGWLTGEAE